jgi:hypothetical protein
MSTNLKAIAARYAGALKAADGLSPSADSVDRPTVSDIWHWKLEEVATFVATSTREFPYSSDYDHLFQYAHRHCLNSREDVQKAPDDVLLASMRLPTVAQWGWLHFIVRELGMTSLIINNWGWGALKGFEGITIVESEEQRRAQAGLYFLDVMRERGFDPLGGLTNWTEKLKSRFRARQQKELDEQGLSKWLRQRNEWAWMVYICRSVKIGSDNRGGEKVLYSGDHRVTFAREIREAAERRRRVWNADYSCHCREIEDASAKAGTS